MALKKPGQRGYKPRYNAKPKGQPNADMLTYDNALPCKNTSCKSHGKPHPNCKCYGSAKSMPHKRLEMAEGGQVSGHFCDSCQPHESDCEYFAEGGSVDLTGTDFDSITEDSSPIESKDLTGTNFDDIQEDGKDLSGTDFDSIEEDDPAADYKTIPQRALAGVEGLARGVAGPVAVYTETHPWAKNLAGRVLGGPIGGLLADQFETTPADIAAREAENPGVHALGEAIGLGASFLSGTGMAGITAKLAPGAVRGALDGLVTSGGDEISHAMLDQGDADRPVSAVLAHMGATTLLGAGTGGAFKLIGAAGKAASPAIAEAGSKAQSFLGGIGVGLAKLPEVTAKELKDGGFNKKAYEMGKKMAEVLSDPSSGQFKQLVGQATSAHTGGSYLGYKAGESIVAPILEFIIGKRVTSAAQKYIAPALIKVLKSGDTSGIWQALSHAADVSRGVDKINRSVEGIFKAGSMEAMNAASTEINRQRLKEYVEEGTQGKQIESAMHEPKEEGFAEGGEVKNQQERPPSIFEGNEAVAKHFPEQNMLMQSAKGRINGYLNSIRPQKNQPKLPFDADHENEEHERAYDKVLDLANQPLSILNHIKNGTLTHETMGHFTQLYPELHQHLSQKLTERIIKSQIDEERPNHVVRQAMSLFLGVPLDSSMTPIAMASIQATFAKGKQGAQQQAPGGSGDTPAKMRKLSTNQLTHDQARAERAAKG